MSDQKASVESYIERLRKPGGVPPVIQREVATILERLEKELAEEHSELLDSFLELKAENERLREALETIAKQKLRDEWPEYEHENLCFEDGYDGVVNMARQALNRQEQKPLPEIDGYEIRDDGLYWCKECDTDAKPDEMPEGWHSPQCATGKRMQTSVLAHGIVGSSGGRFWIKVISRDAYGTWNTYHWMPLPDPPSSRDAE